MIPAIEARSNLSPVAGRAVAAIASPATSIAHADPIGSQRWIHGESLLHRDSRLFAFTIAIPIDTSTAASPQLNATIRNSPSPTRCSDTALSSTTSAAGQGMMPPVIPSSNNCFSGTVFCSASITFSLTPSAACSASRSRRGEYQCECSTPSSRSPGSSSPVQARSSRYAASAAITIPEKMLSHG
jgi:hypothetical protein